MRGGRKRQATTLIELLVVIGIIGVLISMLIPSLKRTMQRVERWQGVGVCLDGVRTAVDRASHSECVPITLDAVASHYEDTPVQSTAASLPLS